MDTSFTIGKCPPEILVQFVLHTLGSPYADSLLSTDGEAKGLQVSRHPDLWSEFYFSDKVNFQRMRLMLVCKYWHDLIVAAPVCWKEVVYCGRQTRRVLSLWIARSGALPLSIVVRLPLSDAHTWRRFTRHSGDIGLARRRTSALMELFLQHRDRVEILDISSACSVQMGVVVQHIRPFLTSPHIQTLGIHHHATCGPAEPLLATPYPVDFVPLSRISHTLRHIRLSHIRIPDDFICPAPTSLVVIDLEFDRDEIGTPHSWDALRNFLQGAPHLEVLRLTIPFCPRVPISAAPLVLYTLHTLTLSLWTNENAGDFLAHLVVPCLRTLSLDMCTWPGVILNYSAMLRSLIKPLYPMSTSRSSCLLQLRTLVLSWLPADDACVSLALQHLVYLEKLVLFNSGHKQSGIRKFLGRLLASCIHADMEKRVGRSCNIACEKLRRVEVHGGDGITESFLLKARERLGFPISCITLKYGRFLM